METRITTDTVTELEGWIDGPTLALDLPTKRRDPETNKYSMHMGFHPLGDAEFTLEDGRKGTIKLSLSMAGEVSVSVYWDDDSKDDAFRVEPFNAIARAVLEALEEGT